MHKENLYIAIERPTCFKIRFFAFNYIKNKKMKRDIVTQSKTQTENIYILA